MISGWNLDYLSGLDSQDLEFQLWYQRTQVLESVRSGREKDKTDVELSNVVVSWDASIHRDHNIESVIYGEIQEVALSIPSQHSYLAVRTSCPGI